MKNLTADSDAPQAIVKDIIVQDLGDEMLVYSQKTHRAMSLNSTVACVWRLCDGKHSLTDIKKLAEIELKALLPDEAIMLAIGELKDHNLLIANNESTFPHDSLSRVSRREMIRKVGVSAAVAIPVIIAITAPTAAMAQSALLADGASCADDTQCQNNCCFFSTCQPAAVCFGP